MSSTYSRSNWYSPPSRPAADGFNLLRENFWDGISETQSEGSWEVAAADVDTFPTTIANPVNRNIGPMASTHSLPVAMGSSACLPSADLVWKSGTDGHIGFANAHFGPHGLPCPWLSPQQHVDPRTPCPPPLLPLPARVSSESLDYSIPPVAPPSLPDQFLSTADQEAKDTGILPPFTCFLYPSRTPMYSDKSNGNEPVSSSDDNNNGVSVESGDEAREISKMTNMKTAKLCHVDAKGPFNDAVNCSACKPSSWQDSLTHDPTSTGSNTPADDSKKSRSNRRSAKKCQSPAMLIGRSRSVQQPLKKEFPEMRAVLMDYLANIIRTARFGKDDEREVAQDCLLNVSIPMLRETLIRIVPGLEERGISRTSVARLLHPLNTVIIKTSLQDEKSWALVCDEMDIVGRGGL